MRDWYVANRERVLAEKKAQYAANPDIKKAKAAEYRAKNAAKVKALDRARGAERRANPEFRKAQAERAKAWYRANRETVLRRNRDERRFARYGLTRERYEEMVAAQMGRCAICCTVPADQLVIDHCHKTNLVRGLLCDGCNASIGRLGDTAAALERAYYYLDAFEDSIKAEASA